MLSKRELAMANFRKGYNCAQAVLLAFQEEIGLEEEMLAKLSSSFGGGIGKLREVCGAVSGMALAAGFLYGYEGPETGEIKAEHYARVQSLALLFKEKHKTLLCRELLEGCQAEGGSVPEARTEAYYVRRPCEGLVGDAAEILETYMKTH